MNIIGLLKQFLPRLNVAPTRYRIDPKEFGSGIPRLIHQTVRSKNDLSPQIEQNVKIIRERNRGWRYSLHDDSDISVLLEKHFGPDILGRFLQINPEYGAARADFFRYCLLYAEGGIYLDIKNSTKRSLDEVLGPADRFLIAQWDGMASGAGWGRASALSDVDDGEYIQWFIACAPGHPFLRAVIENVLGNIDMYRPALHGVGRAGVLNVTVPIAYSLAIHPLRAQYPHRLVRYQDLGIGYSIFECGAGHRRHLTGRHYTELRSPVVRLGTRARIEYRLFYGLKVLRRRLSGRRS
ncbi:glycosyltransferase family 32 protein [Thioalkalivibrio sp. XN279]|uniref:glycosyltransferase family 32 protein n=1 Tax=Thioalkalivibrio sp. XN279 TaxID=2714953 RepID=UPI001409C913|nr:glycosyltransferase [Thioalkalivibrio sp. XN279]NHA15346.1 glycosyltransferase [Thioalkalivibrio sp. XN279]